MQAYRMKRRSHTALRSALLCATLFAAPAFAQSVSADGAKQLQDAIAKTFGTAIFDKGIVTITPQDSAYAVKLDLNAATAAAEKKDVTIHVDPLVYIVTPGADGTYAVTSDSPINYSFSHNKENEVTEAKFSAPCKTNGVFDPKISSFSSLDTTCTSGSMTLNSPKQDVQATFGAIASKLVGVASKSGSGVDITANGSMTGITETIVGKEKDAPVTIKLGVKTLASESSMDNFQIATVFDLMGMAATAGDPKALIPQQDAIKQKLLAALPFWNKISGKAALSGVTAETPIGVISIDSLEESIGVTGAVKDASYGIGIKYAGLKLPDTPVIPDWAKPVIPAQGNVDLTFSGVDLDALARLAIQNFDARQDPPIPDSITPQMLQIVLAGQPHLTLAPSTFTATAGALSAEGSMSVFPSQAGKVTISADKLDQLSDALSKAQVPNMPMIVAFAKGLAKTGPDGKAIWVVDFDAATKAVSVNGQVLNPGTGAGGGAGDAQ